MLGEVTKLARGIVKKDKKRSKSVGRSSSKRTKRQRKRSRTAKSAERTEQSFGIQSGRYRKKNGEFHEGSPPSDYDSEAKRFRANDGQFKSRSQDLGMGEPFDAPRKDAKTDYGLKRKKGRGRR
jgi:hypothetical protein